MHPQEILLVLDSMTGQDAVTTAKAFDENLGIDGTILTKMDGDARGGAALSIKTVTGKPIKMIGVSEKLDGGLEDFHPDRMAGRILDLGDLETLIETAQRNMDAESLKARVQEVQSTLQKVSDAKTKVVGFVQGVKKVVDSISGFFDKIKDIMARF